MKKKIILGVGAIGIGALSLINLNLPNYENDNNHGRRFVLNKTALADICVGEVCYVTEYDDCVSYYVNCDILPELIENAYN